MSMQQPLRLSPLHETQHRPDSSSSINSSNNAGPSTARPLSTNTTSRPAMDDSSTVDQVEYTYQPTHLSGQRLPLQSPPLVSPPHRSAPFVLGERPAGPSHSQWDRRAPLPPPQAPIAPVAPRLPPLSPSQPRMDLHSVPPLIANRRMSEVPRSVVTRPMSVGQPALRPVETRPSGQPESPSLPKVVLHPPEEEEIKPIKLHPAPPPPGFRRPPLVHLPASAGPGRPVSYQHPQAHPPAHPYARGPPSPTLPPPAPKPRNMWGGMADQFGKPAPAFKRSSRYSMAGGVIMPKTKEDMIRDKERRASMMYFDELREKLRQGEIVLPPRRTTSLALGDPASEEPILSPPIGAFKTQRSHSAPSTPMTACFEHSSPSSVDPKTGEEVLEGVTRSESEPSELPFLSTVQEGGTDSDAASACITGDNTFVDSPVALTSPQFPRPSTEEQGRISAADSSPTVDPLSRESPSDQPPALMPVVEESDEIESDEVLTPSSVDAGPAAAAPAPAPSPSLKRRSMSMSSANEAKPPKTASIPPSTTTAPRPTVVRKQKSLSRFFFSNSDLSRVNGDSGKQVPVEEKKDGKANQIPIDSRKGRGGMLSRPKSSPALRTQARESRHAAVTVANDNTVSSATSSIPLAATHTPTSTQLGSHGPVAGSAVTGPADGPATVKPMKKRFSLSNLSSAFKRSKKSNEAPAPQVPTVPSTFKKEVVDRASPGQPDFADVQGGDEKERVVSNTSQAENAEVETPQEDSTETLISPASSPARTRPANRARSNTHMAASPTTVDRPGAPSSPKERSSIVSDTSSGFELDAELSHARLMLVSPQTRRNPSKTFQEILNVAPVTRQSKIIKLETHMTRRSVEAIVLGPLLLAAGDMRAVTEERDEISAQGEPGAVDAESEIAVDEDGERRLGRDTEPSERRGSDETSTTIGAGSNDTTHDSDLSDRSMGEYTESQTSLETMSQSSCASEHQDKSGPVTPSSPPIDAFIPSLARGEGVKVGKEGRIQEEEDDIALVFPLPPDVQAV